MREPDGACGVSSATSPTWIEIATLIAALLAATGPVVRLWEILRGDKERLNLHIDWVEFGPNHELGDAPFLYVANLGERPVFITDIHYLTGLFFRKRRAFTALEWDDPIDLAFPYTIEPNQIRRFHISEYHARRYLHPMTFRMRVSAVLKRSTLWIEVRTSGGTRARLGAEDVLPWSSRPEWRKVIEKDND